MVCAPQILLPPKIGSRVPEIHPTAITYDSLEASWMKGLSVSWLDPLASTWLACSRNVKSLYCAHISKAMHGTWPNLPAYPNLPVESLDYLRIYIKSTHLPRRESKVAYNKILNTTNTTKVKLKPINYNNTTYK